MIQSLNAELPDRIFTDVQIDGEYHRLETNKIQVDILPNPLTYWWHSILTIFILNCCP